MQVGVSEQSLQKLGFQKGKEWCGSRAGLGLLKWYMEALAITNHIIRRTHYKRKQKWASKCDWEFPKPCFRLKHQFQAIVRTFSRVDTETNFSASLQEKGCVFPSLSLGLL